MNVCALTGRFTSEPELKTTSNGVSVTSFCLAVDRKYQPSGEEKKADFIDCVAWRNTAEFICKYFNKGSMIGIEGEIQTRTFEDKNGNKRKATEVVVGNASFCGSKVDNSGNSAPIENDPLPELQEKLKNAGFAETGEYDGSDLPF